MAFCIVLIMLDGYSHVLGTCSAARAIVERSALNGSQKLVVLLTIVTCPLFIARWEAFYQKTPAESSVGDHRQPRVDIAESLFEVGSVITSGAFRFQATRHLASSVRPSTDPASSVVSGMLNFLTRSMTQSSPFHAVPEVARTASKEARSLLIPAK